ncbi:hypothetical protein AJ79_07340 [Helicocarpus griseus UAMH5409]|uniref:F-box domain-containing protein n=1 Tax=Helicocarpus griseus UAMH5409 TaxID=1447875 RepID=A0A2B7X4A3_9EURO|nr:hypothetical protein AJ79_07340 [Helicocarpus griseus UAMH5409]
MALSPGLGALSKLPPELRELIWLEFLPVGGRCDTQKTAKADLRVLQVSKCLYTEIACLLYPKTTLHFDLSPSFSAHPSLWCMVRFTSRHRDGGGAVWRLESNIDKRSHRFDNFPFHKIESLTVSFSAPDPRKPCQLFWLWRNSVRTTELLKKALSVPPLTIQLVRTETHNWLEATHTRRGNARLEGSRDYDLLVAPFYTLLNLKSITIKAPSEDVARKMDWTFIHWLDGILSERTDRPCGVENNFGRELYGKVMPACFWVHVESTASPGLKRWTSY